MNHETSPEYKHTATTTTADAASNALHRAGDQAAALAQRGADAMQRSADALHRSSDALQSRARHYRHEATAYIHREPAKSMLIAAATGATLMALLALMTRMRNAS
jgi:ElaB/YqjD/DUF883 family membrane-anchored ribosome-binding protein